MAPSAVSICRIPNSLALANAEKYGVSVQGRCMEMYLNPATADLMRCFSSAVSLSY